MISPDISIAGLIIALFLPWLVGIAVIRLLSNRIEHFNGVLEVAYGYFFGIFLTTLVVRCSDALGAGLNFPALAVALAMAGGLALLVGRKTHRSRPDVNCSEPTMPALSRLIVAVLLGLLLWRYGTLLADMIWRPLFAWDAWMNWAPKAIVWFINGELSSFVQPGEWSGLSGAYTLGNAEASTYPETVPLIFLWHMLGAGIWDHSLLQLPWILAAINLGLVLFGHFRLAGASILLATVGSYFLLSIPFVNVHSMLAGYADIWLAAAFSIGLLTLREWERHRETGLAIMSLIAAVLCTQLKNPGIVLGLILVVGLLRTLVALSVRAEILILSGTLIAIVLALRAPLNVVIPIVGPINMAMGSFQLGQFGPYILQFHQETTGSILDSMFVMANWHLLWYLAAMGLALQLRCFPHFAWPSSFALVLVLGLLFYIFVFFFTNMYLTATSFVTLNRAILYFVPVLVFALCMSAAHMTSSESRAQ